MCPRNLYSTFALATALFTLSILSAPTATSAQEFWELGPFTKVDEVNPILHARNDTIFRCPIRNSPVWWEQKDVFNPTALVRNGILHMLYRAEDNVGAANGTSRIGLALSNDGLHFDREIRPIFYPDNDEFQIFEWEGGCEDPRIVEDASGTYYMTYTAYDGETARLFVASSTDLRSWVKHGSIFRNYNNGSLIDLWSKAGSIICDNLNDKFIATRINGRFWMYFGETSVFLASSDDLINWEPYVDGEGDPIPIFAPREGYFDSDIVEPGPQAFTTRDGILLIYNSRNKDPENGGDPDLPIRTYSAGQVLLSLNNPAVVLHRLERYFMKPEKDYEIIGQVGNVVFLEGLVSYKGLWYLYYGTADSKIAVAVAEIRV